MFLLLLLLLFCFVYVFKYCERLTGMFFDVVFYEIKCYFLFAPPIPPSLAHYHTFIPSVRILIHPLTMESLGILTL